jgi:hypothetical protein
MSNDISVFGLRVSLTASETFPGGLDLSQWADDADPFDTPAQQVRDKAMGVNGDLITWSKANPIGLTLSVVPNSEDDVNLAVLLEANRVGKGKTGARDVLDISVVYPDGLTVNFTQGAITDGAVASGAASSGRLKSKTYTFAFENVNRS